MLGILGIKKRQGYKSHSENNSGRLMLPRLIVRLGLLPCGRPCCQWNSVARKLQRSFLLRFSIRQSLFYRAHFWNLLNNGLPCQLG